MQGTNLLECGSHTSYHLIAYSSDHHPILISADLNPTSGRRRRRDYRFQFEESWATLDECKEVIQDAWSSGNNLSSKLKMCTNKLVFWKRVKFEDIHSLIRDMMRNLDTLQRLDPSEEHHQQIRSVEE